jgi:hypothetical protein
MIASPASPPSHHKPTTQPILYHRTGGIAGTDDRVVIWPDGLVQVTGRVIPSGTTRLKEDRLANLAEMFRGWQQLHDEYLANVNDAYSIDISYGDKTVSAMDLAPDLPEQFRKIYTEIEAIAAEAGAAPAQPAP